ncbi:MAG: FtsQ-type POTRA domain-containing protein [Chloroflexota bacterium]|nr:FtsQ-type POTRA domain-containing protein [Chloroflexota bacterium]
MFVLFGVILVLFFSSDVFYVRSIQVRGNDYVNREEVFAFADIADFHMFWLDPEEIHQSVLRSPSIADISVELGWPPNLITIIVQERQPTLIWADAAGETWLDIQGRAMPARAEMPNLLHIHLAAGDYGGPMPRAEDFTGDMVLGALKLKEILPEGEHLSFHPVHGLGWTNELGWQIWMGSDSAAVMSEKVKLYDVLAENYSSRAIPVAELNIANPEAPFYRVIWGL